MTYSTRRRATAGHLALAVLPVVSAISPVAAQPTPPFRLPLATPRITAFPLNSPPINGFVPSMVVGLTNQQAPNDQEFAAHQASSPGGTTLPSGGPPHYVVATFDTGASSHIITNADYNAFNIEGANRGGSYQAEIVGASGSEFADISDPIGVYVTGLGNATGGSSISVTPGTLQGQWNTSILSAEAASVLPNIIGAPLIAQYQVAIRTSEPQTLVVGATTYHSPQVELQPLNTAYPALYSRLTFDVMSPNGVAPKPVFIPSLENFNNFADNPTTPTFWMSLFANVNASNDGNDVVNKRFLFDTGAQVTVMSQDTAAEAGFYSAGPHPSTPDFEVEVSGVGGNQMVPGFYVDNLRVMTNGGPIVWNNVPVLVLDLIDPADGVGFVPGILGMNLFTDRDIIVNGGLTNPSVGISPQAQWWVNSNGNWSNQANWMLGVPDSAGQYAQFFGRIAGPRTITVDNDYTIGHLAFDNANSVTVNGPGRLTLQVHEGDATISAFSGSHTVHAPMTLSSPTSINVAGGATLTMTNDVLAASVAVSKVGAGVAQMKNIRSNALNISEGALRILPAGNAAATSDVKSIAITAGKLDLKNNALIVRGASSGGTGIVGSWNGSAYTGVIGLIQSGYDGGTWNGDGIVTSQSSAISPSVLTTLAASRAGDVGYAGGTFAGRSVTADDVLVMYTYGGDSNLDGVLNGDDYFQLDSNIALAGTVFGYINGDFNYDGDLNGDDYFIIDSNINAQGGSLFIAGGPADLVAVPEPGALAALAVAMLPLPRRRAHGS